MQQERLSKKDPATHAKLARAVIFAAVHDTAHCEHGH